VNEGRQANLSWEKKSFLKKRKNIEKLISFLGAFHRKMNQVYLEVSKCVN